MALILGFNCMEMYGTQYLKQTCVFSFQELLQMKEMHVWASCGAVSIHSCVHTEQETTAEHLLRNV